VVPAAGPREEACELTGARGMLATVWSEKRRLEALGFSGSRPLTPPAV
jgi:hypothetical protein